MGVGVGVGIVLGDRLVGTDGSVGFVNRFVGLGLGVGKDLSVGMFVRWMGVGLGV